MQYRSIQSRALLAVSLAVSATLAPLAAARDAGVDAAFKQQAAKLAATPPGLSASSTATYIPKERRVAEDTLLPNFDRVDAFVYRGAQPELRNESSRDERDGISLLAAIGIRAVVNLREEASKMVEREARRCAEEGIAFYYTPLPRRDLFGGKLAAREPDVAVAVAAIRRLASAGVPVYVHCQHGADRTGVVVALLRLLTAVPFEAAAAEARDHGFHFMQRGMWSFVESFKDPQHLSRFAALEASARSSPDQPGRPRPKPSRTSSGASNAPLAAPSPST